MVEKTIGQMRADMESGLTTSQEITRAYLDRIEVYDQGQFGFNAYEIVADDAMAQATAADAARAAGKRCRCSASRSRSRTCYDTYDMATTNGSLTFAGFRPTKDAFQVAKLREAGAVIIGKAALEEYATSGNYSNDPWGQVWNAFNPSKSAIASERRLGDRGRRRTWPPARWARRPATRCTARRRGASLVTLRGTDGLESGSGIMPLSWLTDFGGAMTRSVADLADMLNVVAGTDPGRPDDRAGRRRASRRLAVDARSRTRCKGKRIGYIPSTWVDPFGTTGTTDADEGRAQVPHGRGRDDRRDGRDRGRHQHAARAARQPDRQHDRRRAGCSTSTRTRSWPSRASRSATRST